MIPHWMAYVGAYAMGACTMLAIVLVGFYLLAREDADLGDSRDVLEPKQNGRAA